MRGLRGAFSMWLALIALQTLSTKGASGRVGTAFADVNTLVERVLDAKVPAIPDRRLTNTLTGPTGTYNGTPNMAEPVVLFTPRLPNSV